ncbi:phage baseplate assembly protein gpV [Bradyrhizobium liaoningense]|uniref:Phage baseplate assembly protein V n=1 Tax=Bradyrhizobium barranii subsp. barranii TaxID=2823807 RepID=A0A7Z0Q4U6_9BRAD|nr:MULTISPECIES: phage baseplate assembly protein V [Bradyrhizobium]MCP1790927.1 phage baseplate assembly protein gpV [Bradyrhizobium japonicum]MCP1879999.1 phage baseplate assembly protein gpV [Bradyrhizobium japonicum]MCP1934661.1 phage baseplate assembly protein gpV [Bradyrhizobium japonicum]MCP1947950.1 phage baseplate assembly protein gpV [Bradyrhizobium japonicum]MCS4025011.1 phage baseplate assembly protein gpV [Bradyrhizobium japonicum]
MVKFLRDPASTGGVSDPEATDIDRRAQDVVKFGKIKEVDYKRQPPAYRVLIGDENDEDNHNITDWLPAGGMRAKGDRETHFLEKDEKVVLLAEGGELATAQVYPAGTYTPENEDEKETTDKAGVWRKIFAKPKSKGGQDGEGGEGDEGGGEGGEDGGEDGEGGEEDQILGEISYDRNTGDWLIKGIKDKGSITLEGSGCKIVMKDGTITMTAKNLKIEMEENVEIEAGEDFKSTAGSESVHEAEAFVTVAETYLGVDSADDKPQDKVVTEAGPAKQTFAKVG